jgi:putative oxidoreductase
MVATVHPIRRRRFHGHPDAEAATRELEAQRLEALAAGEREQARRDALYLAGRLIVSFAFITRALTQALSFSAQGGGALAWLSIAVELVAGALLALGLLARRAAAALLVCVGLGTLVFHGDWSVDSDRASALANLALCGALLAFVAHGGGALSVDQFDKRRW